ncbi:winged helix-turn-helix domain-containing protein [Thalassotalea profundi]|uniref:OmpR/PhoB-type domain-containing protein n=1 Tax=Thalassotalea profundi TaxID=2036687 RepID=A0ABQ3IM97_9GAMM|nr:winged helix-turn-helix domain-containing protein [Thalassotalea profundi]GHE84497.1 hypothetical protein GCM10011501_11530 [Thalassotalea profundi]
MRFLFGDIVVDAAQVKLTKNNQQLACEPRVFELLVYFCNHANKAISRNELLEHVWEGRVVSDAAVNRAVGELRKLLEVNPSSPQLIKTISRVGYCLAVTPTIVTDPLPSKELMKTESIHDSSFVYSKITRSQLASTWLGKRFWLFLLISLTLVVFTFYRYQLDFIESNGGTFRLLSQKPVTISKGSSFNPFYHSQTGTLVFLHRKNANAYAQVYMRKQGEQGKVILSDDYYYTDVIYTGDGFIYASRLNNLEQRLCEIVKVDPETKEQTLITKCGEGVITQIALDEYKNRLIYQSRASISEPYSLYSYLIDTGRKQQLTHPAQIGNNTGDYAFALSPNGHMLAVIEYRGADVDKLKLLDLNTHQIIVNKAFINNVYGLVWNFDHQVLGSNGEGLFEFDIKTLKLTSKEQSVQYGRLALGDNRLSLLTERSQQTINIYSYLNDNTSVKALTSNRGVNLMPVFGNNSNIMAFRSNSTGIDQIFIQPENKPAYIAEFNSAIESIGAMAWSESDEQLLASINNTLYLYSLVNKRWTALAKNFNQVHYVTFVEHSIMFSAEVDGQWNIWKLSLHNNEVSQITFKGGYSVQGNTDTIYITKFNRSGLYQIDLKLGVESVLIENFPIAGWRHWQLRDNKIYYLEGKEYKVLDLSLSLKQTLHYFEERKPSSCNMSFQHKFFACEKVELSSSNIWQIQLSEGNEY